MASYDADPVVSVCLCGNGRVTATHFSPNFPFGKSYYSDVEVHCEKCKNNRLAHYADAYEWSYDNERT